MQLRKGLINVNDSALDSKAGSNFSIDTSSKIDEIFEKFKGIIVLFSIIDL